MCKNQKYCGQMRSWLIHYSILLGIERKEKKEGKGWKEPQNKWKYQPKKEKKWRGKEEARHGIEQPLLSLRTCASIISPLIFFKTFFGIKVYIFLFTQQGVPLSEINCLAYDTHHIKVRIYSDFDLTRCYSLGGGARQTDILNCCHRIQFHLNI